MSDSYIELAASSVRFHALRRIAQIKQRRAKDRDEWVNWLITGREDIRKLFPWFRYWFPVIPREEAEKEYDNTERYLYGNRDEASLRQLLKQATLADNNTMLVSTAHIALMRVWVPAEESE